jgi:hypothetical protein
VDLPKSALELAIEEVASVCLEIALTLITPASACAKAEAGARIATDKYVGLRKRRDLPHVALMELYVWEQAFVGRPSVGVAVVGPTDLHSRSPCAPVEAATARE